MATHDNKLWQGLSAETQKALATRDYAPQSFAARVAGTGIEAGKLAAADRTTAENREAWIPGVEIFPRPIHFQRHRGVFGEGDFADRTDGLRPDERHIAGEHQEIGVSPWLL